MPGGHPRTMKIRVSLSRWRERVRVRVERSAFPFTSILSPEGRGGIFWVIFQLMEKAGEGSILYFSTGGKCDCCDFLMNNALLYPLCALRYLRISFQRGWVRTSGLTNPFGFLPCKRSSTAWAARTETLIPHSKVRPPI